MKSLKFTGEMEKIKAKWTQVSLKNVLKVKDRNYLGVLIYLTGKFSYLLIAIGLALGGEGTLIKEKNSQ